MNRNQLTRAQGWSILGGAAVMLSLAMGEAPALAGQTAGLIHAMKSAQQIIDETVAEFFSITGRLGAPAQARSFG